MSETPRVGHYIDGQVHTQGERSSPVFNPATGEVQAQVALASLHTVEQAVASARRAFPAWAEQSALRRSRVMICASS